MSRHHAPSGFSLLEVLISVLLISLAFLSTASLHIRSLRDVQQSSQVVIASELAQDLVERLNISSSPRVPGTFQTSGAPTAGCFNSTGCTPADMISDEVAKWKDTIDKRLPGGGGTICRDLVQVDDATGINDGCSGAATDPIVIKVWWPLQGNDATTKYKTMYLPYVRKCVTAQLCS